MTGVSGIVTDCVRNEQAKIRLCLRLIRKSLVNFGGLATTHGLRVSLVELRWFMRFRRFRKFREFRGFREFREFRRFREFIKFRWFRGVSILREGSVQKTRSVNGFILFSLSVQQINTVFLRLK